MASHTIYFAMLFRRFYETSDFPWNDLAAQRNFRRFGFSSFRSAFQLIDLYRVSKGHSLAGSRLRARRSDPAAWEELVRQISKFARPFPCLFPFVFTARAANIVTNTVFAIYPRIEPRNAFLVDFAGCQSPWRRSVAVLGAVIVLLLCELHMSFVLNNSMCCWYTLYLFFPLLAVMCIVCASSVLRAFLFVCREKEGDQGDQQRENAKWRENQNIWVILSVLCECLWCFMCHLCSFWAFFQAIHSVHKVSRGHFFHVWRPVRGPQLAILLSLIVHVMFE